MDQESGNLSDLELAKRLQAGDMDAFGLLYGRHYRFVRYYCAKFIKNEKAAEDLAHDTFMAVLTRINQFKRHEGKNPFKAWLARIASNLSINYLRRASKMHELELAALEEGNLGSSIEPRVEKELHRREFKSAFWKFLKTLSEPMRQCFVCHYLLGIEYADLCRIYGLRQYQVAHIMSSGRRRLAKELRSYI